MDPTHSAGKRLLVYGFTAGVLILLLLILPLATVTSATVQLRNDNDNATSYISSIRPCWLFGSVLQADDSQYPLRVLSVDFTLYRDFQNAASNARVRAVVYSIGADGNPDTLLAQSGVVDVTTFYPEWVSISLTNTQVLLTDSNAFLAGIEYVDGVAGTIPSVMMDSNTNIPVGRNFYSQTCGGSWFEHYEWWADPANVGYNMVRATVDTNVTLTPTWTPTPTRTPTPGPSPTPIPGQVAPGRMVGVGKQHALARTADSRVHLVYADPARKQLYHIWSNDNGVSWQPSPPLIAATADEMEAALASGLTDTLHLAYGPWDGHEVYYSRFDGANWSTAAEIGDQVFGRNIAVDSQGHIHVVWSFSNVWYTKFDGADWSMPKEIAFGAWHPAIAVGPDDSLHIAYNDNNYCCDNDGVEVRYIYSTDGGDTWSQPENVSDDSEWSGGASLAISPNGTVHLTYIARSPIVEGGLVYRQRNGGQWSPKEIISSGNAGVTTGSTGFDSAAMAVDAANNVLVLFRCLNAANRWDICLRIHDWQGWLPVMNLTNNTGLDSRDPGVLYGTIPENRGLDSAWYTGGQIIYNYYPRNEWPLRPTPTPTPTPTPSPGAYYVRVVDEEGAPVDGARIYHNGSLVADVDGLPMLTQFGGVLNFNTLQPGDSLVAIALQNQRATSREGHSSDPDPRYSEQEWAYRTYLTSVDIDEQGLLNVYYVPEPSVGEHRLVVKKRNPLVLFNIVASIEWDATESYTDQISRAFRLASDYLYDLTDGQMALGQVTIYDNGGYWADADVQISAKNVVHPHAYVGGITADDKSHVIRIGRGWDGESGNQGAWDEPAGFRTLAHEFGHYALYLYDEYFAYTFDEDGNLTGEVTAHCTGPENKNPSTDATNASAMDFHYTCSELSAGGVPGLWSTLCQDTAQWQLNGQSAWETIVTRYSNPPQWQFKTPSDRGGALPGPVGLSSILPSLPSIQVYQDGPSAPPRQLTVYHPNGGGFWGAIVALYREDGQVIGQGFTDGNGQLDIYGAVTGDTLRAASFDGGLAGSVEIGTEADCNLVLTPITGAAVHAANGIPHIRVVAEPSPNPEQIDLFVFLQNFGSGTPPQAIITEPSTGIGRAVALSYRSDMDVYEGKVSLSAAERGMGHIQAFGEVGGRLVYLQSSYHLQQVTNLRHHDVHSSDGNLSLHLDPGSLPGEDAYLMIAPPGAVPGPLPDDLVLIGNPYDMTASGALVTLEKPAILKLYYDEALVAQALVSDSLGIYHWDPNGTMWQAVRSSLDKNQQAVVAPVKTLGTYALLAPQLSPTGIYLPLIIRDVDSRQPTWSSDSIP